MRRPLMAILAPMALLTACGSPQPETPVAEKSPSPSTPATFTVYGDITLDVRDRSPNPTAGAPCYTFSTGYEDIKPGLVIKVNGADGSLLASGELLDGVITSVLIPGAYQSDVTCEFPFVIQGVPEGEQLYSVEAGRRGAVDFQPQRMRERVKLTL